MAHLDVKLRFPFLVLKVGLQEPSGKVRKPQEGPMRAPKGKASKPQRGPMGTPSRVQEMTPKDLNRGLQTSLAQGPLQDLTGNPFWDEFGPPNEPKMTSKRASG